MLLHNLNGIRNCPSSVFHLILNRKIIVCCGSKKKKHEREEWKEHRKTIWVAFFFKKKIYIRYFQNYMTIPCGIYSYNLHSY